MDVFYWTWRNHSESIFENPMFCKLKKWHQIYDLHCDLYIFERSKWFSLRQLQNCYWGQLACESDWLKFAWHRRISGKLSDASMREIASLKRVQRLLNKRGVGMANSVRLHRWKSSDLLIDTLKEEGFRILLTSDNDQASYNLSKKQENELNRCGIIEIDGMKYSRTDLRLDRFSEGITPEEMEIALCNMTKISKKKTGNFL